MARLFFSYSHRDEPFRDELEIHLSSLKRQGLISSWHDRRIGAGRDVENEIDNNIRISDIILLLISPYFIASDYCYEKELQIAMERHKLGEARVIPIILHPCDWQSLPFGKLLALPQDGKPISKFPNQHDAFLDITNSIRLVIEDLEGNKSSQKTLKPNIGDNLILDDIKLNSPRSSNLRVKKTFTDHEKDKFLLEAFEYISNFFEQSLKELELRNPSIHTDFRKIDANHFSAVVYKDGNEHNRCTIWLGDRSVFSNGIAYSIGDYRGDNSLNESLSVEDDGYTMFLKPLGLSFTGKLEESLSLEGGAEYYWGMFIEPLQ